MPMWAQHWHNVDKETTYERRDAPNLFYANNLITTQIIAGNNTNHQDQNIVLVNFKTTNTIANKSNNVIMSYTSFCSFLFYFLPHAAFRYP